MADFIFVLVVDAKVSRLDSRIESVVLMSEELICTLASFIDVENVEVPVVAIETFIPDAGFKLTELSNIILELLCIEIFTVCLSWLSDVRLPVTLRVVV